MRIWRAAPDSRALSPTASKAVLRFFRILARASHATKPGRIMSIVAVSSFSLHSRLGPWHIDYRDEAGSPQTYVLPMAAEHTLEEFIGEVRTRFNVSAVELCQLQFPDTSPERISSIRAALDASAVSL